MSKTRRIPRASLHRASGQSVVRLNGRDVYLGKHGSAAARAKYRRVTSEWLAAGRQTPPTPGGSLSVNELLLAFLRHATGYYVKGGRPTAHLDVVRAAIRRFRKLHGHEQANSIGPKAVRAFAVALANEEIVRNGKPTGKTLSRRYVNDLVAVIKRGFAWGVGEELIPPSVSDAISKAMPLKKGRTTARETPRVPAVSDDALAATLPFLPVVAADLVRFMRATGCRPGEGRLLRPRDIDTTGDVWVYTPAEHKTEHHGLERKVFIGPKGQAALRPYLSGPADHCCFAPRGDGRPYAKDSLRQTIARACRRAGVAVWKPNQVRHSAGTQISHEAGPEASRVCLGHASVSTTAIYIERDEALARATAKKIG